MECRLKKERFIPKECKKLDKYCKVFTELSIGQEVILGGTCIVIPQYYQEPIVELIVEPIVELMVELTVELIAELGHIGNQG